MEVEEVLQSRITGSHNQKEEKIFHNNIVKMQLVDVWCSCVFPRLERKDHDYSITNEIYMFLIVLPPSCTVV